LTICLNDIEIEELTQIVHAARVTHLSRRLVEKLRDEVPSKPFKIAIQAKVGSKVIARENVKALRMVNKFPNAKGDRSRKLKILKDQAESRRKMKNNSSIELSKNVLINIIRKE
jgi:translation elongation factor EF-4